MTAAINLRRPLRGVRLRTIQHFAHFQGQFRLRDRLSNVLRGGNFKVGSSYKISAGLLRFWPSAGVRSAPHRILLATLSGLWFKFYRFNRRMCDGSDLRVTAKTRRRSHDGVRHLYRFGIGRRFSVCCHSGGRNWLDS